jgi:hypothetical protein
MANRLFKQFQGTLEAGVVQLMGSVTTSTSGTIASTSCKGFSVAKTGSEVGRYTVTLADYYSGLLAVSVTLVGAADAAYTTAKGSVSFLRNVSVSSSAKTFDIQFARSDTTADAEVLDAAVFYIQITLKNTSAY